MDWESLDSVGSSGSILIMWKTSLCIAREVIRGSFSLTISFYDMDGKIWMGRSFLSLESMVPQDPREEGLLGGVGGPLWHL